MRQYKVITKSYESDIYDSIEEVKQDYYKARQFEMKNIPDENTYVSIIYSDNNFIDYDTMLHSVVVIDEEAHRNFGSPRDNRFDFDYWCKWEETEY